MAAIEKPRLPKPARARSSRRFLPGLLLVAIAILPRSHALPTTSVLIENLVSGDTPAAFALKGADGLTALSAGTAANGDGAVVALGYFADATATAVFTGAWTPLTGPASANEPFRTTSIGDTGSGASGPFGYFTALVNFDQSDPTRFRNTPPTGTRLALAVYSGTSIGSSSHFNIATNDNWRWKAPSILPDIVSIDLNDAGTIWFGGMAGARHTSEPIAQFPGVVPGANLVNLSTRGFSGTGDNLLISGFVLQGTGPRRVLIRAIGPTLAEFDVGGSMQDPMLKIFEASSGLEIAANDNWSEQTDVTEIEAAFALTGAFPLPAGSRDAALLLDLQPTGGGFTAQIEGIGNSTGVVIAEVYAVDGSAGAPRLANLSTRGFVGTGESLLIPGFALGPGSDRRLLIRAVGPTLGQPPFNLSGVLADPILKVFSSPANDLLVENTNWEDDGRGTEIAMAAGLAGAFALAPESRDAALIFEAAAGSGYTVQITSETGQTGIVIAEIYELP